jgi:hypothetical protein
VREETLDVCADAGCDATLDTVPITEARLNFMVLGEMFLCCVAVLGIMGALCSSIESIELTLLTLFPPEERDDGG